MWKLGDRWKFQKEIKLAVLFKILRGFEIPNMWEEFWLLVFEKKDMDMYKNPHWSGYKSAQSVPNLI